MEIRQVVDTLSVKNVSNASLRNYLEQFVDEEMLSLEKLTEITPITPPPGSPVKETKRARESNDEADELPTPKKYKKEATERLRATLLELAESCSEPDNPSPEVSVDEPLTEPPRPKSPTKPRIMRSPNINLASPIPKAFRLDLLLLLTLCRPNEPNESK